jgi:hypothetical protein
MCRAVIWSSAKFYEKKASCFYEVLFSTRGILLWDFFIRLCMVKVFSAKLFVFFWEVVLIWQKVLSRVGLWFGRAQNFTKKRYVVFMRFVSSRRGILLWVASKTFLAKIFLCICRLLIFFGEKFYRVYGCNLVERKIWREEDILFLWGLFLRAVESYFEVFL